MSEIWRSTDRLCCVGPTVLSTRLTSTQSGDLQILQLSEMSRLSDVQPDVSAIEICWFWLGTCGHKEPFSSRNLAWVV